MLSKEDIRKHATELKHWLVLEQQFIDQMGRSPNADEAKDLMWQAEVAIWGSAGCGRCKPGFGCRRNQC